MSSTQKTLTDNHIQVNHNEHNLTNIKDVTKSPAFDEADCQTDCAEDVNCGSDELLSANNFNLNNDHNDNNDHNCSKCLKTEPNGKTYVNININTLLFNSIDYELYKYLSLFLNQYFSKSLFLLTLFF